MKLILVLSVQLFMIILNCQPAISLSADCGLMNFKEPIEGRVIGGHPASPNTFRWQLFMYKTKMSTITNQYKTTVCGASILSARWAITAGHCVVSEDDEIVELDELKAALHRKDQANKHPTVTIPVKRIVVHPEYRATRHRHDLALIEFDKALDFEANPNITKICLMSDSLAPDHQLVDPTDCFISGFGSTERNKESYKNLTLQYARVKIFSTPNCSRVFEYDPNYMLCAGGTRIPSTKPNSEPQYVDACQGDSGGPLVCRMKKHRNRFAQVGVVSYGDNCAYEGYPGMYTKLDFYNSWIEKVMTAEEERKCGIERKIHTLGRIIDGEETERNELSWTLLVKAKSIICGGVLIKNDWGLTAASCVNGSKTGEILVVAGARDKKKPDYKVSQFFIHSDWRSGDPIFDNLAILRLKERSVKFYKEKENDKENDERLTKAEKVEEKPKTSLITLNKKPIDKDYQRKKRDTDEEDQPNERRPNSESKDQKNQENERRSNRENEEEQDSDESQENDSKKPMPVCWIEFAEKYVDKERCFVAGFGKTSKVGRNPKVLRTSKKTTLSEIHCKRLFEGLKFDPVFHLCTRSRDNCDDRSAGSVCVGDVGSPLMCPLDDGTIAVVGLVADDKRCGDSSEINYDVYVKLDQYYDWIQDVIQNSRPI